MKLTMISLDDVMGQEKYDECIKGPLKIELCKGLDFLGLRPTAHQVTQLCQYLEQLLKWNKVYNLTAIRDINEMLVQHLFDCLTIIEPVKMQCTTQKVVNVLDVGSGAGLPAVVIAILNSNWSVSSLDAVHKKMAFVQQLSQTLKLSNLSALHERIENVSTHNYDLIVSRAFSSLQDFVILSKEALADGGIWCAMKGKEPIEEIANVKNIVDVFHVEHIKVPAMEAERCLVWMKPKR